MDKIHQLPFVKSTSDVIKCFDLIHLDLWGPAPIKSVKGYRFFLTIVDDKSENDSIK